MDEKCPSESSIIEDPPVNYNGSRRGSRTRHTSLNTEENPFYTFMDQFHIRSASASPRVSRGSIHNSSRAASFSCRSSSSTTSINGDFAHKPDWLEIRNFKDLTECEMEVLLRRFNSAWYTKDPFQPITNYDLGRAREVLEENLSSVKAAGSLPFVAFDLRRPAKTAIVGGAIISDFNDEDLPQDTRNLGPIALIIHHATKPIYKELQRKYNADRLPRGIVLSSRFMFIHPDTCDSDGYAIFIAMEREIIVRAKAGNFKHIVSTDTHLAAQVADRDMLGYKEVSKVFPAKLETSCGKRLFPDAPLDLAMSVMVLDL